MTLGIIDVPVINSPSWSIGIEFWLSALFLPLLVRGRVIVLLILAGAGYLFVADHAHGLMAVQTIYPFVSLGLIKGVAGMALGAAIYKSEIKINALFARLDEQWLAALMVLALAFIASGIIWQGNNLLNFAVILAIVPILARDSFSRVRTANDFLSSKPLVWLGTISFSLYLVHTPMLVLLRVPETAQSLGDVNAAIFLTVVCVIAAAVLHYFFEKPVARAVKNFNSEAGGASIWAATIAAMRPRRKGKEGSLAAKASSTELFRRR
ncbi:acyltransferase [Rhizobium sp. LCM 4573]|uniref:acyltransferase family protein n=1 Tax=Rhizobium sp. LCM 4573 TaxID=1848291 RepID=UPI0008DA1DB2|nr:acyltransferase family protein [Rhizobium sp. LCM 4573]OHV77123.1 hypothetical protein LCM4573_10155 [Rhizobium sp. LCM 4573]